ncbi:hypothetical protein PHISP_08886, partial [Aspergillus sp. HF37]
LRSDRHRHVAPHQRSVGRRSPGHPRIHRCQPDSRGRPAPRSPDEHQAHDGPGLVSRSSPPSRPS